MRRNRAFLIATGAFCVMGGCQVPAPLAPHPHATVAIASAGGPSPKVPTPSASLPAAPPGASAAPIIAASPVMTSTPLAPPSTAPGALGVTLSGILTAPATLVSDHGGGLLGNNGASIIANNGSSLIGNHGASWHLLAATPGQVPVANAPVVLLDAAGQTINGTDGKPLVTTSGADGSYSFAGAPGTHNLLVSATLPGNAGQLVAIAPRATEARTVNLDLVSTLTTGYIYNQFVAWQKDPVATLEKLPPAVEADTRGKAQAAFASSGLAAPPRLDRDDVTRTMAALRQHDAAFDAQMETVRRLLVAAGQSNLGDGRPADQVALGAVQSMGLSPDGSLYFATPQDSRIWRLLPDGSLHVVLGGATTVLDPLTGKYPSNNGKAGPQAMCAFINGFCFDRLGRLLVTECNGLDRVSRLELDGTVTEVWRPPGHVVAAVPGDADGEVWVIVALAAGVKLYSLVDGALPVERYTFPPADAARLAMPFLAGSSRNAAGDLVIAGSAGVPLVLRYNPTTHALTSFVETVGANLLAVADATGNAFRLDTTARTIVQVRPDGTTGPLASELEGSLIFSSLAGVALGPDGTGYVAGASASGGRLIYRFTPGKPGLVKVAGAGQDAGSGQAQDLALSAPSGVVPLAGGDLLVADAGGANGSNRIVRVATDGTIGAFAGMGAFGTSGDGGPAKLALLNQPSALGSDAGGTVYFIDGGPTASGNAIRAITPDLTIHTLYQAATRDAVGDLAVAPDGTLYFSLVTYSDPLVAHLMRLSVGQPAVVLPSGQASLNTAALALSPAGELYGLDGAQKLWKLVGSGAPALIAATGIPMGTSGDLACDAQGRLYYSDLGTRILRIDPGKAAVPVVGTGTGVLAGSGTDDSVSMAGWLTFDAAGDLYFADIGHKQVKHVRAAQLP